MDIYVNDSALSVDQHITIPELLKMIQSPENGIAVAVNDTIVPRSDWSSHVFREKDNVLVIKAHSGG